MALTTWPFLMAPRSLPPAWGVTAAAPARPAPSPPPHTSSSSSSQTSTSVAGASRPISTQVCGSQGLGELEGCGDRPWVGVVILSLPQQQEEMIMVGIPLRRTHGVKCKPPHNANGITVAIPRPGLPFEQESPMLIPFPGDMGCSCRTLTALGVSILQNCWLSIGQTQG